MSLDPTRRTLRDSQRRLARGATVARLGLIGVGMVSAWNRVAPLASDGQFTWGERRVMGAAVLVTLGGFALAGWAAGWLLKAGADLVGAVADAAEDAARTGDLVESRVVPTLDRAVRAIEQLAAGGVVRPDDAAARPVRRAIAEGRWGRAERLLGEFDRDHPHSPERAPLAAELAEGRRAESDGLRARLDDALAAGDPASALDHRDALTRHLGGEPLRDLDRRLARWLATWVRGRVRRGDVTPEVAEHAARGADRFGDSDDGRALLAALPDLRRKAGLCPTCSRPYRGPDDACPACLPDPARTRTTTPRGTP